MGSAEPLVLIVDDYQDAREMYAEYLKASGFRVAEARTGLEAVAKARELLPDCILMDAWWADRRDELRERRVEVRLVQTVKEERRHDRHHRADHRHR